MEVQFRSQFSGFATVQVSQCSFRAVFGSERRNSRIFNSSFVTHVCFLVVDCCRMQVQDRTQFRLRSMYINSTTRFHTTCCGLLCSAMECWRRMWSTGRGCGTTGAGLACSGGDCGILAPPPAAEAGYYYYRRMWSIGGSCGVPGRGSCGIVATAVEY